MVEPAVVVRMNKLVPASRALVPSRALVRAALVGALALGLEWSRALLERVPALQLPALLVGGGLLCLLAAGWRPDQLGLGGGRIPLRLLGGLAIAGVLLLPTVLRGAAAPGLPPGLAAAAIAVSIGEEIAFRGAFYAALEAASGPATAIAGSAALFTAGHVFSHPVAFLIPLAAAGTLLGLWRWAFRDLLGPIVGHVLTDLAL